MCARCLEARLGHPRGWGGEGAVACLSYLGLELAVGGNGRAGARGCTPVQDAEGRQQEPAAPGTHPRGRSKAPRPGREKRRRGPSRRPPWRAGLGRRERGSLAHPTPTHPTPSLRCSPAPSAVLAAAGGRGPGAAATWGPTTNPPSIHTPTCNPRAQPRVSSPPLGPTPSALSWEPARTQSEVCSQHVLRNFLPSTSPVIDCRLP